MDQSQPQAAPDQWSLTARELAAALVRDDGLDDEVVEIVVADHEGNTVEAGIMQISVGTGSDLDRSGAYRWRRITARMDPPAQATGDGAVFTDADLTDTDFTDTDFTDPPGGPF